MDALLRHGATTIEAKTGYGLSAGEELRQLEVLSTADAIHPVNVVPTFLAAHAIPEEYAGRADAYVDLIVDEMLPVLAARGGGFVDAFCDVGAFDVAQTRRILERAAHLGLGLKVHSDEFAHLGCTALAAELGATSADHLVAVTPTEMDALARAGTVGVLLPGTTFGLGSLKFAPAREMIARGVPVALGSDLNPGTCPCTNLQLIMALACRYLGLQPAEALVAFTRNAAISCGRGQIAGRLAAGWPADLTVFSVSDYRALAYEFGANPVAAVMVDGAWVLREAGAPDSPPPIDAGATD
jgi:imidazolonepropionase